MVESPEPRKEANAPAAVPRAQAEVEVLPVEAVVRVELAEVAPGGCPHGHRRPRDPAHVDGGVRVERLHAPPCRKAPEEGRERARLREEPEKAGLPAAAPLGRAVREAEHRTGDAERRLSLESPHDLRQAFRLQSRIAVENDEEVSRRRHHAAVHGAREARGGFVLHDTNARARRKGLGGPIPTPVVDDDDLQLHSRRERRGEDGFDTGLCQGPCVERGHDDRNPSERHDPSPRSVR